MGKGNEIPQPPGWPILGNLFDIDMELPLFSLYDLAKKHGEIYRMKFPGHTFIIANSYAMVNEFCDEKRFPKTIFALKEMRHAMHDGLFTAIDGETEPAWSVAHRILVPAFGPTSLRSMFDGMYDVASQLVMKWARHGQYSPITVTDDFTRLTLDTIALCSMDFRFNSYYKEGSHPFVTAMSDFLTESGDRGRRLPIPSIFYKSQDKKFFSDIKVMRETAHGILQERKKETSEKLDKRKDLLSAMLNGTDPKTGLKMTEESILDNLITFLIAGHETTSGMLSFALYHIIKDPEVYRKVQTEVDNVCGTEPIRFDHLNQLSYILSVLRETLRLTPPLPVFNVAPKKDEIVGGKYVIKEGELVIVLIGSSQLDSKVFGDDVHEFKPDRLSEENFERLNREFPNAWKPFGNGTRGCIGRPFALQEAILVLGMLFQCFDFRFEDPDYHLKIKQTLTVKPANFTIKAVPRHGMNAMDLEHKLAGTVGSSKTSLNDTNGRQRPQDGDGLNEGKPMSIYYGSNSGTCQTMAERLATDAYSHGFRADTVTSLDEITGNIPTDRPVVFLTASYEGQPPDNAARFVPWLEKLGGSSQKEPLRSVEYAVFGCGNRDWTATFHRIPRLVDALPAKLGAVRVADLGLTDVSRGNEMTDFEAWEDDVLWPALTERYDAVPPTGSAIAVRITSPRKSTLRQNVEQALVLDNTLLTAPHATVSKYSMEVKLPEGMSYTAGDYLAVLPINRPELVHRVLRRFGLPWDAHMTIEGNANISLPEGISVPVIDVFGAYVELLQPATKRDTWTLHENAQSSDTKLKLSHLMDSDLQHGEPGRQCRRESVLELLERYDDIDLPISSFLRMLPPMRTRQYSIGSSSLAMPTRVILTYSKLDIEPGKDGSVQRHGVATSFLSGLRQGDMLQVSTRPSHAAFHLPSDPATTPIIMIAAGTGIAPFRGFIEERSRLITKGLTVAPGLLFFGCRRPDTDDLYREDLDKWEAEGAITVKRAYSRANEGDQSPRYVQDALTKNKSRVLELWDGGAMLYICGSKAVGDSVKDTFVSILADEKHALGVETSRDQVREDFEALKNVRYAVDVFD